MVLFLQAYKNRFSSIEDYQFQRAFSYAVYAHLHILDLDEEELEEIHEKLRRGGDEGEIF